MSYDIKFQHDEDYQELRGAIPDDQIDILETALRSLAEDPFAHSTVAKFPYRVGRRMAVKLRIENKLFYVTFFFVLDSLEETIVMRGVAIDPPLSMKGELREVSDREFELADETFIRERGPNPR